MESSDAAPGSAKLISALRMPCFRKALRPRLKGTVVLEARALRFAVFKHVGAEQFVESSDGRTWFRQIDFGTSDALFPQSALPSVEVYGGIRGKGAAICGI